MKKTASIMTMPVLIEIAEDAAKEADIDAIFQYFRDVDEQFSVFKETSEISRLNRGQILLSECSAELQHILQLCEKTRQETFGYFDVHFDGRINPTGLVKGYAIHKAAEKLRELGYQNFAVEIAGDIEVSGHNVHGEAWRIGIQNPFQLDEIVKVARLSNKGIATSGSYQRGKHIYDPMRHQPADAVASLTVIGPNVYEADRFVTPAFAMGEEGIRFIQSLPGLEAYMITQDQQAIMTPGFFEYVQKN